MNNGQEAIIKNKLRLPQTVSVVLTHISRCGDFGAIFALLHEQLPI